MRKRRTAPLDSHSTLTHCAFGMPTLARHLQEQFAALCPDGWICEVESRIVGRETEMILGFAPQADVVLLEAASGRRISVELEISRADPVANHAKFAAAHLRDPFPANHSFVSMMSRHIAPGRRNLGAQMIGVLRAVGMRAFQTVLLPGTDGDRIMELNHSPAARVRDEALPVEAEIERVLQVALALGSSRDGEDELHFAANSTEVLTNVRSWNLEMERSQPGDIWKRRRCRYFVHDPVTNEFAPCKFAAYVCLPAKLRPAPTTSRFLTRMSLARYQEIDQGESIFDGNRAWNHLVKHLAFSKYSAQNCPHPETVDAFLRWIRQHEAAVHVGDDNPVFLEPPPWA